jgi:hypothetical protein
MERASQREREREKENTQSCTEKGGEKTLDVCSHQQHPGRANAAVELMAKLDLLLLKSITAFVSLLFFFFFRS